MEQACGDDLRLELIAKGYKEKTPVTLWHVGNYAYEIKFNGLHGTSTMLLLDTAYEDAMRKLEGIVDYGAYTTCGP